MIEGRLVRLRAIEPEADAPAYHRWFNDPLVVRHLDRRYPISLDGVRTTLDGWAPISFEAARFSVELLETGELAGFAALRDATPESRHAELDLVVGERSLWGRGIGTDATRTICRFGFEEMGLHRVRLYVYADNTAAIRAYRRVGFVREGVQRDAFHRRGAWHDCLVMGLLEAELKD